MEKNKFPQLSLPAYLSSEVFGFSHSLKHVISYYYLATRLYCTDTSFLRTAYSTKLLAEVFFLIADN